MKRFLALIMLLCLVLCGCSTDTLPQSDKLQIVCATFPAYDFAREIAGDKAEITLLIKPGAEVHSYEPTPKDVVRIQESDLFICNGGESEEWLEALLRENMNVVYMMDCVETVAEEEKEGMYVHGEEEGEEELDEHVWTSPVNAALISKEICSRLCEIDAENAALYTANSDAYTAQLMVLDADFHRVIDNAPHKTLVFADRFPMRYFTKEYGLEYFAAFPGCASETEPSAKTVAFLIDRVREEKLPAVLYMEFSNQKMADVICEDTGCVKLPFYSAHNITAEQFEAGVSYLDLMRINLETLKEALY
ncbi:MAG: metal ABC transporter substrate-binding protein [Bacillota bacterium]|nr:metal ABC transporter substrate-binding protein [Bacillota bacterium]